MKHMSLELEMLEKRIAPGLPIIGCTILCGGQPSPDGGGGSSDGQSCDSGDHDKSSNSAGSSGSHSSGHSS